MALAAQFCSETYALRDGRRAFPTWCSAALVVPSSLVRALIHSASIQAMESDAQRCDVILALVEHWAGDDREHVTNARRVVADEIDVALVDDAKLEALASNEFGVMEPAMALRELL